MLTFLAAIAFGTHAQELDVFAAASLKDSFQSLAKTYEKQHPGVKVVLNFGGSQQLASQINQGAPADLFASASPKNLDQVAFDTLTRKTFAFNQLVVVTPKGTTPLKSLEALAGVQRIVLAAPAVPVGGYSRTMLKSASAKYGAKWLSDVKSKVVSEEQDVKAVLAKVQLGEADAGIVYLSDAVAAKGKVQSLAVPKPWQPKISYPVAVLKNAQHPTAAREFITLLLSAEGKKALKAQGFTPPQ